VLYDLSSVPIFCIFGLFDWNPTMEKCVFFCEVLFYTEIIQFSLFHYMYLLPVVYIFRCINQVCIAIAPFRYRVSNNGKFPSVNLTHKEVGGSYYIVREIVRDIIQENRVLGPGGLNAKTLSFEDCPDSSELSTANELGQDNIEILDMSDEGEAFPMQKNFISTQQLLGSDILLEPGILNSVAKNGNVGDAACLEEDLEKQDEALYLKSEISSSEIQAPSLAHVSDLHREIDLNTLEDSHEGTTITDEVTHFSDPSDVSQINGGLLHEHVALPDDCDDITNSAVDEANLCLENNGVLQTSQVLLEEHEILPETASIMTGDVQITDGEFVSPTSANQMDAYISETSAETLAVSIDCQDVVEQPLLDADPNGQATSEDLASQPALDAKVSREVNSGFCKNWSNCVESRSL
jgi:hypothetical protein